MVAAPVVLGAVGFTSAGIAAGSLGASMMSVSATASGGGVVAGEVVATLQSVAAGGLDAAVTAALLNIIKTVVYLFGLYMLLFRFFCVSVMYSCDIRLK